LNVYSPSRLATFENGPRQFEFRYVQKIRRDTESVEAYLGKRVHEILERLYHHVARHRRPPSLRQVLDRYRGDWELRWHDGVEIVRSQHEAAHYRESGSRCLENYYRSHYPFDQGETVAIEHRVQLRLDEDGRYRARGIIDRLVRHGQGRYEIHDYKTGGWLPPQERLDRDRQLALYQVGIEQGYDDAEEVELVWHYLQFDRTLRSRRTPEQLRELRGETIELIERIEGATEYPARPSGLCRWCEYRGLCPDARVPLEARGPLPEEPPPPGDPPPALRERLPEPAPTPELRAHPPPPGTQLPLL
jgi:putative RecB family exonuclease